LDLTYPPTVIWRHKKENLKKCSLRGLEQRPDFLFFTYPTQALPALDGYVVLTLEAPPLTAEDAKRGLLLIDATWRYAAQMEKKIAPRQNVVQRSIPAHYRTSYPRCQTACADPDRGLASIEALYVAYRLLGRDADDLLENYYWREGFLERNS
jgi:pre-rRNA-processing protein TSR3